MFWFRLLFIIWWAVPLTYLVFLPLFSLMSGDPIKEFNDLKGFTTFMLREGQD